jgi:2-keto-4-pentenoate hydratase/2-oxohepta-3-ene-1,7-dioic acid hydratase in catechol pathway
MSLLESLGDVGFAFIRVQSGGDPFLCVVRRDVCVPFDRIAGVTAAPVASINDLLAGWDATLDMIQVWLDAATAQDLDAASVQLSELTVLSPVEPRQVFQAAANYRKHVIDLMVASPRPEHIGQPESELREFATTLMDHRAASGTPTIFQGLPSSICGPYDDVIIPLITEQCDWELELAAVIGTETRHATSENALTFVAGYTIVNDVSMRDFLYPSGDSSRGADWLACKGAPTFLPAGPVLVPARFVPDLSGLTITLTVNGKTMQNEAASDMIFSLPRLIEHTSKFALMLPGDILLSGSPAGNGVHHGRFLAPGDVMEGTITGLGSQRNGLVAEEPEPAI